MRASIAIGHRFESTPPSLRLRNLLANTFSGKSLLVQAITYPVALPAIASPPPGIAEPPSPTAVIDPAPQDVEVDIYAILPAEPAPANPLQARFVQPPLVPEIAAAPPVALIPAYQLNHSTPPAPTAPTLIESSNERALPEEPETVPEPVAEPEEFSWFELNGLTAKDNPQKQAFVTRLEEPISTAEPEVPILLAGPQDLNPGFSNPEPEAPAVPNDPILNNPTAEPPFQPDNNLPQPAESIPIENTPAEPDSQEQEAFLELTDLEVGINSDANNFGQSNWSILPTLNAQLANGDRLSLTTGLAQFNQTDFDTVSHTPVTLGWQTDIGDVQLATRAGIDLFNRLSADTHASAIATAPIGQDATIAVAVDQGPYLFNAQTLENEISRWQYGPEVYWQIAPKLSLFSKVRFGNYSDGNAEQQSFSRLERTIGEDASVALNFINQSFRRNAETTSGYFSPRDFIVATAEMSWREQIAPGLNCSLLGSIGQQRLDGDWAVAYSGRALCTVDIGPAQIDLGYQLSNVSDEQSALIDDTTYSNQQVIGGIRVNF